jgi:hypothetical protein
MSPATLKRARTRTRAFRIPMTGAFLSCQREDGKVVIHSLDFDIVAVSADEASALKKIHLAVKTHIEYGLSNNWIEDIIFPAPAEYWEQFMNAPKSTSPPIDIEDDRMIVVRATIGSNERCHAACTA